MSARARAQLVNGRVVITTGEVTVLDVDAYAAELLRDLAIALCEQKDSEGIA